MINIAASITTISIKGSETLFSTSAIMINIAAMDIIFTTLKSLSVVSIISFIQGASPISMPDLSYFLSMVFSFVICSFTGSLATLYSELTSISFHLLLSSKDFKDLGRISLGTPDPISESSPNTYLIPSTFSISLHIALVSLADSFASTRSICVLATLKSFFSLLLAIA